MAKEIKKKILKSERLMAGKPAGTYWLWEDKMWFRAAVLRRSAQGRRLLTLFYGGRGLEEEGRQKESKYGKC